ncbi:DUF1905 domain-containing protein [Microcella daejeonensis]|uniref:DUF1905 domain-containing protein n=1 Tax=Microcella daejeonensis TaxID=2994971 RepID=UPI002271E8E1|nr:DUF1905 domain-containing protein [Microcella daejeonensis]WAB82931.1 DUF1905 domain-containing protein [Microcella daejeonensis]
MTETLRFSARLVEWEGPAAWWFLRVPLEHSERILAEQEPGARGFGSVRVEVTVGATRWRTSLFPDSASGCYLLPVKKAVRASESLDADAEVDVSLTLL